ncbi:Hypothetical predicted protein [Podarcis lilfordi]|uniref:Uncharacterized protein n=1 Tax=Podarcis lilfordi TaxID=74358 RepID=A0AA35LIG3_9SAUR|nr:Hypothetical predicted protein [Podarcis lilfordi]
MQTPVEVADPPPSILGAPSLPAQLTTLRSPSPGMSGKPLRGPPAQELSLLLSSAIGGRRQTPRTRPGRPAAAAAAAAAPGETDRRRQTRSIHCLEEDQESLGEPRPPPNPATPTQGNWAS